MLTYFRRALRRLFHNNRGASAVEYAVLVAGVAALIVLSVMSLGSVVQAAYKSYCDVYTSASGTTASCGPSAPETPAPSSPPPRDRDRDRDRNNDDDDDDD